MQSKPKFGAKCSHVMRHDWTVRAQYVTIDWHVGYRAAGNLLTCTADLHFLQQTRHVIAHGTHQLFHFLLRALCLSVWIHPPHEGRDKIGMACSIVAFFARWKLKAFRTLTELKHLN